MAVTCQLEVKLSVPMYTAMSTMPMSCVFLTGACDSSFSLKMAAPVVMATAITYLVGVGLGLGVGFG